MQKITEWCPHANSDNMLATCSGNEVSHFIRFMFCKKINIYKICV